MQENNRTVRFLYLPVCIIYMSRSRTSLSYEMDYSLNVVFERFYELVLY